MGRGLEKQLKDLLWFITELSMIKSINELSSREIYSQTETWQVDITHGLSVQYCYMKFPLCSFTELTNWFNLLLTHKNMSKRWSCSASYTLRAETFAGKNFHEFCNFGLFSRKLMPGKKLDEKFAKVVFAKI